MCSSLLAPDMFVRGFTPGSFLLDRRWVMPWYGWCWCKKCLEDACAPKHPNISSHTHMQARGYRRKR